MKLDHNHGKSEAELKDFGKEMLNHFPGSSHSVFLINLAVIIMVILFNENLHAQKTSNEMELYGFLMTDAGYNFNTINPDWYDVMRVTQLPSYKNEFAPDGKMFFSMRQTRFGVKSNFNTALGKLKTQFDFDFFGVGADKGQTTFHLVNAYGQLGRFGAGQTATAFMDFGVFPQTLDYWGPTTRAFYLNIQLFYIPIEEKNQYMKVALERPGGSAAGPDESIERIDISGVKPYYNLPNLTAQYRFGGDWGYVTVAGVLKSLKWREISDSAAFKLNGSAVGWGTNLSAVINTGKNVKLKFQGVIGQGMENYLADVSPDVGLESNSADINTPYIGKAIPIHGFFAFAEILWNSKMKSSLGYSYEKISNTNLQPANAYRQGQYALVNLLYTPMENFMTGVEYQFGRRDNFSDGFHSIGNKLQISFKYFYSQKINLN
ncbi:MAG TPA: DcaP family trimeric outer membrane transporter [Ignavibacteria bacterium]|nr:DcaP family trimeric outer membrane transporter [Ignavibacteria bacterium]